MMSKNHHEIIDVTQTAIWNGMVVEHRRQSPAEMATAPTLEHFIGINLGHPFHLVQARNGLVHEALLIKGQIVLAPAGYPGEWVWDRPTNVLHIHLDPALVLEVATEGIGMNPQRVELLNNFSTYDEHINYISLALKAELDLGCVAGHLYGDSLATALIVHLLRKYSAFEPKLREYKGGLSEQKLRAAIEYINDNLAFELSLAKMAAYVGISSYYFARLFKQSTGLPPHQYVIQCRIEQAKILLTENKLPITEVGYRIGCTSQSNFTTFFRKHVGMTPKAYRDQTKK